MEKGECTMRHRASLLTPLCTMLAMLAFAGSAAASVFRTDTTFTRIVWNSMHFIADNGSEVECPVTLEGSLNSTMSKLPGPIGQIHRATFGTCRGGSASALASTLPWRINYVSFTGRLPEITDYKVNLVGASIIIYILFFSCRADTSAEAPLPFRLTRDVSTGRIHFALPDPTAEIPLVGLGCVPNWGRVSGGGEAFVQGSSERRIILSLI